MSLSSRTVFQASGQRTSPLNPVYYPPMQSAARRSRTMVEANRPSEWSRPAVGHSTYPLLELRSGGAGSGTLVSGNTSTSRGVGGAVGSHAWLPACVRHIVTAVGQQGRGPMLQLVFSSRGSGVNVQHRFETVPVSQSLADNPTRWPEFSDHVRSSGASGLVLVRPIASPDQHCVYAAAAAAATSTATSAAGSAAQAQPSQPHPTPAARTPAAGGCCTDAEQRCSPASAASSSACQPDVEVLSGQVGECCGPDSSPDRDRDRATSSSASATLVSAPGTVALVAALPVGRGARGSGSASGSVAPPCEEGPTQYFGLVVQGSAPSEADGCWVLKTTRSDLGGAPGLCSCTHFTLTRVCLGAPLYSQLRDAWLVR